MSGNPIDDIERDRGFADMGKLAVQFMRGALEESDGDFVLAIQATAACMQAIIQGASNLSEDQAA